jgi:hypothetical protein
MEGEGLRGNGKIAEIMGRFCNKIPDSPRHTKNAASVREIWQLKHNRQDAGQYT